MKKTIIAMIAMITVAITILTIDVNAQAKNKEDKQVVKTQIELNNGDVKIIHKDKTSTTQKAKKVETTYDGDKIIELQDGSIILYNLEKGNYIFYPDVMGDWCIEVDNMQQLNDCVVTYLNNSNGMNMY